MGPGGQRGVGRQGWLAEVINKNVERGGILIIPAFAVGRTQELLFHIRELETSGANSGHR